MSVNKDFILLQGMLAFHPSLSPQSQQHTIKFFHLEQLVWEYSE